MRMRISPIGRRTGQPIIKKNVRTVYDGTENFDDYWTDSSYESQTANESTFIKRTQHLNELTSKSSRKSKSVGHKRSLSSSSAITDDETFSKMANNSLNLTNVVQTNPCKRRMTQRDFSIQTSQIYTPATEKAIPKQLSSLRKRISFNNTTRFGGAKSARRESRNRSFAGEKTWLDKSINTINFAYEERSIQTSDRKSSPQKENKENQCSLSVEGRDSQSNMLNETHRVLQEKIIVINGNSPLRTSFTVRKRESRNRSFAGEKTWIDKSINTVNFDNKEQSVQTSQRYSSPRRCSGKESNENPAVESKQPLSAVDKTSPSNIKDASNEQGILQEKKFTEVNNSGKKNSSCVQKEKTTSQDVESIVDKTQPESSVLSANTAGTEGNSKAESTSTFVVCHGAKEHSATNASSLLTSSDITKPETAIDKTSKKTGRKQKKHTADKELSVQHGNESHSRRKSKRNRVAPLAYWRNERRIFQNKEFGNVSCIALEKGSNEDRKPLEMVERKLKKKKDDSFKQHNSSFDSLSENGVCYKPLKAIRSSKTFYQKDGKEAYIISKAYSNDLSSIGCLQIAPGCKKEEQYSPTYDICFTMIKGQVDISINDSICKLKASDFLRVPIGVPYSIQNPGKIKAIISFTTFKSQNRERNDK